MKAKKVKRIISAAFLTLVMSLSALTVFAVINEQWWQTAEGHFTLKNESVVCWQHFAKADPRDLSIILKNPTDKGQAGDPVGHYWVYATASGNGSVVSKRSAISASSPAVCIGYMTCSYNGTRVFTEKEIIRQMTNSLGTVIVTNYYGILDRTTGDLP